MPISQITGASIQDGSIVVADLGITTFNTGTGNTLTLQANSATGLVISVTGNTAIANSLSFSATGARITGDMSNGTIVNRVAFQSSTTNGQTAISAIPNGTSLGSSYTAFNNSDPTNASTLALLSPASGTEMSIRSGITGSGTYLPLTMYTGGSERLRIDTSGNMMLGTTSASGSTKFDVYGNSSAAHIGARVTNAATDGYSTLWLSSSNDGLIRGGSTAGAFTSELAMLTSGSIPLTFYTANTKRMTIGATGNIGIGTASPSQLLHVAAGTILASNTSSTTATVSIAGNGSTTGTSDFSLQQGTSSEAYVFNRANSFLVIGTNNTERMRITSAGDVGIGTTVDPFSTGLNRSVSIGAGSDISVGLNISSSGGSRIQLGIETSRTFILYSDAANFTSLATTTALPMLFQTNNTERMRILSGGQLLVGTNSISAADQNETLLFVNSGLIAGRQKIVNNSASFFNTSTGNTRNITIQMPGGEYYAKLILVGLCGYFGGGYFTRIVEFTGYGDEARIATMSNVATGGNTPPTVTMTAPSNGIVNAAVAFPTNYRCVAYLQTAQATGCYISSISGTNV